MIRLQFSSLTCFASTAPIPNDCPVARLAHNSGPMEVPKAGDGRSKAFSLDKEGMKV